MIRMIRLFTESVRSAGSSRSQTRTAAFCWLVVVAFIVAIPVQIAGAAPATVSAGSPQASQPLPDERTPLASEATPSGMFGKSQAYLEMLERYLTLMEKFARMTEDPAASGSAAVLSAREILTSEGDLNKAIDYFTQVLPDVKNQAVQRTIHIELSELYKHAGQKDKALDQLRILMISAPAESLVNPGPRTPLSDATSAQHP